MLVVLEKDVVKRTVLFNEVALQGQGLEVGFAQHQVKVVHARGHGGYLGRMGAVKILAHAVFEVDGLADIDNLPFRLH